MAFDRLEAMRAFCRIVEVGSFTAAAQALGVAKTTISGQLQALELKLGVKLLHRTTRRVTATPDGAVFYERAKALLDDIDELEALTSLSSGVARGRVRVEMPSPLGRFLVIPALPDFVARYPEIKLDIGCSERVVDLVYEGVDCAIRGGAISDPDLVCRPVGKMRFTLCASPKYLASAPALQTPDDIEEHRFLAFVFPSSGRQLQPVLQQGDASYAIEQMPEMRFNNAAAYIAAGEAGLGIVAVPKPEVQVQLAVGTLVEVLPGWHMASMPLSLVYPYTRRLSKRVRTFADWMAALMAESPLWRM